MLEIMPADSKELQLRACSLLKAEYLSECAAYYAKRGERILALCQFTVSDKAADIRSLNVANAPILEAERTARLLIFGVLSFLDACGVSYVRYLADSALGIPDKMQGFKRNDDGIYYTEIDGFFDCNTSEDQTK